MNGQGEAAGRGCLLLVCGDGTAAFWFCGSCLSLNVDFEARVSQWVNSQTGKPPSVIAVLILHISSQPLGKHYRNVMISYNVLLGLKLADD